MPGTSRPSFAFVRRARALTHSAALLAVAVFSACKDSNQPLDPPASITVEAPQVTLSVGRTSQIIVTLRDAAGNPITGRTITFSSSNVQVATVTSDGVIAAVTIGTAQITVSCQGKNTAVAVTTQAAIASVVLAPLTLSVPVGGTFPLTATANDASGSPLAGRTISFQSSNPSVATVTATGVVAGVAVGSAIITASAEGKTATSQLTIVQIQVASVSLTPSGPQILRVNTTLQVSAVPRSSTGEALSRPVTFSSTNTDVATISATGLITAIGVGAATIVAESEGKNANFLLSVTLQPVATVEVTSPKSTLLVTSLTQFGVILKDSADRVLSPLGRGIAWSSNNNPVATVSTAGVVAAISTGLATVSATVEGKTGTLPITVIPVPVASVVVNPPVVNNLKVGSTLQLQAFAQDSVGGVLGGRPVTWTTSDAAKATVTTTGFVNTLTTGVVTITATVEGKQGTSVITIVP